jgi:hypothetical protein
LPNDLIQILSGALSGYLFKGFVAKRAKITERLLHQPCTRCGLLVKSELWPLTM